MLSLVVWLVILLDLWAGWDVNASGVSGVSTDVMVLQGVWMVGHLRHSRLKGLLRCGLWWQEVEEEEGVECEEEGVKCEGKGVECEGEGVECEGEGVECEGEAVECEGEAVE